MMSSPQGATKVKAKPPAPPPKKSHITGAAKPNGPGSPAPPPSTPAASQDPPGSSSASGPEGTSSQKQADDSTVANENQDKSDASLDPSDQDRSTTSDGSEAAEGAGDEKDSSGENPAKEAVALTRIGRQIQDSDGKFRTIDEAEWDPSPKSGPGTFAITVPAAKRQGTLTITSPLLLSAFNVALKQKGDPHITKSDSSISLKYPYPPLYFHYDKIISSAKMELERSPSSFNAEDLVAMEYYYEKWISSWYVKLRETIKSGWVTYDDLWALFQPGEIVYGIDNFQQPRLYVIAATLSRKGMDEAGELPPIPFFGSLQRSRFAVEVWYIDWDPSVEGFKRERETKRIDSFNGSRRITDLEFYPLKFYSDGNQEAIDELLLKLRERGHKWKALVSEPPVCMYYNGPATEFRRRLTTASGDIESARIENKHLKDRIVVDHAGYKQFGETGPLLKMTNMIEMMFGDSMQKEPRILMGVLEETPGAPDSAPASEPFSDLQAQLSPSQLYCCLPRTTTWYTITIAHLSPVKWEKDAIEALVIDKNTKQTLCDLVEEHKRGRLEGTLADFIGNKGQALILVLHGPPGVGKTLTAEAIAEFTERPLYAINIGELSSEQRVVPRLEDVFELSVRWDAVLLIDEADVVLEKRSLENLQRNAVVSVFLRMLEYYRGILFLTTNRLGTMDVAFQSRVSLAIRFNPLTPELRREIWLNFINRLDPLESEGREQLLEKLDDLQEWELNGRQIRNVLRMAQSIALARKKRRGAMRFAHVEQIVNETLRFQDYFDVEYRESRSKLGDLRSRAFLERRVTATRV